MKKAAAVTGEVWKIEKKKFGGDWSRRIRLFDRLIWAVMNYGVVIWWRKRKRLERLEERYLRWDFG